MKLRDNADLVEGVAHVVGEWECHGTSEQAAVYVLDLIDRALATPSPETGGAPTPPCYCASPNGTLHDIACPSHLDAAQSCAPAGVWTEEEIERSRKAADGYRDGFPDTAAPAAEPGKPAVTLRDGHGLAWDFRLLVSKEMRLSSTGYRCAEVVERLMALVAEHAALAPVPAAEPGKPVTKPCPKCGGWGWHGNNARSPRGCSACLGTGCAPAGVWTEEEIERSRKAADGYRDVFPDTAAPAAEPGKPAVTLRCQEFCTRCGSPVLPSVVCECPCHAGRATPEKGGRR